MPNPISPSEQMLYCTIPISLIKNNKPVSNATAFFFNYQTTNGKSVLILITNRHFVENVKDISLLNFSLTTMTAEVEINVHLTDDTNNSSRHTVDWYLHPSEDLAFCFWNPIKVNIENKTGKQIYLVNLEDTLIPSQTELNDLKALENVVMIGYPSGLYDQVNNLPLLRTGSTSSHPAFDFNGRKHGMVDMACIPGSSGSPIFILNEGLYSSKTGNATVGDQVYFLGIENMSPMNYSPIIDKVTIGGKDCYQESTTQFTSDYINLGFYIKSSELSSFKPIIQRLLPPTDILK